MNQNWFKGEINKKLPEQTYSLSFTDQTEDDITKHMQLNPHEPEYKNPISSTKNHSFCSNQMEVNDEGETERKIEIQPIYNFEIIDEKPLGKGNFGEVWRGIENGKLVAIKILKSNDEQAKKEMHKEVSIFR